MTDSVGRKLLEQMGQALGQNFMAENKGGAGGTVGMAEVAKAPADGYTLALSAISPLTLSPHLMKLPYDPFKDIVAVAPMMYSPVYVLGTTAFSGKSWDDLIAQAKAKPGSIRIAAYVVIISGFVTMVDLLLQAYLPALSEGLGVFIPLIVVNCIILGRAEAFASKNGVLASAADGLTQGLGYTVALVAMCIIRELLGSGAVPTMG